MQGSSSIGRRNHTATPDERSRGIFREWFFKTRQYSLDLMEFPFESAYAGVSTQHDQCPGGLSKAVSSIAAFEI